MRKFIDLRSLIFGLSGTAWAIVAAWHDSGWQWWILGSLVALGVGRIVFGHRVRAVAFGVGALAPIIALYSFLFGYPVLDNWRHHAQFDQVIWARNERGEDVMWPPRLCMVDDLLRTHDLRGWGRSQVVSLLGEPDQTNWDTDGQLVYHLGPERGLFRIDSEWLVVTVGDDGKVTKYVLARD